MSNLSSRRKFIQNSGSLAAFSLVGPKLGITPESLTIPAEASSLPDTSKEFLLISRTSFGVRQQDMARIKDIGYNAYLEEQLDYDDIDDSKVDKALRRQFPSLNQKVSEMDPDDRFDIVSELKEATAYRQIYSKRQLFEVMVEFWSNHFSVFHLDGPVSMMKTPEDKEVIRQHALGKFKDLLMASAKSPAMIYYLDNYSSTKDAPNENYARELLELHTLGADNGYSQKDVQEVARCFTGWTITGPRSNLPSGEFQFVPAIHDTGSKKVLGKTINSGGIKDGEGVINLLAERKETSEYICQKLVRRFVSDNPGKTLVKKAARKFRNSDGDIKAVLRVIFKSSAFKKSYDQKLKRPAHFIASAVRVIAPFDKGADMRSLLFLLRGLGQLPFMWQSPDGYPDVAEDWINTNAMLTRWNYGMLLAGGMVRGISFNHRGFIYENKIKTPAQLLDSYTDIVLQRKLLKKDKNTLLDYIAEGKDPDDNISSNRLNQKAPMVMAALINSPYFQWR